MKHNHFGDHLHSAACDPAVPLSLFEATNVMAGESSVAGGGTQKYQSL
jgi:hypothetical protein